jgi:hypothetical protein
MSVHSQQYPNPGIGECFVHGKKDKIHSPITERVTRLYIQRHPLVATMVKGWCNMVIRLRFPIKKDHQKLHQGENMELKVKGLYYRSKALPISGS